MRKVLTGETVALILIVLIVVGLMSECSYVYSTCGRTLYTDGTHKHVLDCL